MRKTVALAILLAVGSGTARAETVAATMKTWGLTGEWSTSCDAAPGKSLAARMRYLAKPDGSVFHVRNFGDSSSSDPIRATRVTPEGWLELQVFFQDVAAGQQDRTFAVRKVRPGVVQAMYNYNAKGEYSVRDGKFTGNGNDTPLQYKCD
jgi:hypothetical protein